VQVHELLLPLQPVTSSENERPIKRKNENETMRQKRFKGTSEKTRRFATLNKMHEEQLRIFKNIDTNISVLASNSTIMAENISRYVNVILNVNEEEV
jgi:hypothetical protein